MYDDVHFVLYFLSPFATNSLCEVASRPFHISLSVAHSSLMFQAFRSLLTVHFHRNFGFPLGQFPSIFMSTITALMFSVSSLLLMCSDHSNLLFLITIAICSTFASSKISSFFRCSNRLAPIAHRAIIISVVVNMLFLFSWHWPCFILSFPNCEKWWRSIWSWILGLILFTRCMNAQLGADVPATSLHKSGKRCRRRRNSCACFDHCQYICVNVWPIILILMSLYAEVWPVELLQGI